MGNRGSDMPRIVFRIPSTFNEGSVCYLLLKWSSCLAVLLTMLLAFI